MLVVVRPAAVVADRTNCCTRGAVHGETAVRKRGDAVAVLSPPHERKARQVRAADG